MLDDATRARMRLTPAMERAIERLCGRLLDIPDALQDLPLAAAKRRFFLLRRHRDERMPEEPKTVDAIGRPPFAST